MVPINSQVLELKPQSKVSQNYSNTIQFLEISILKSLDEALENDSGNELDHSYSLLQRSQVDTDSPLSLLPSTQKSAPITFSQEF